MQITIRFLGYHVWLRKEEEEEGGGGDQGALEAHGAHGHLGLVECVLAPPLSSDLISSRPRTTRPMNRGRLGASSNAREKIAHGFFDIGLKPS